MPPSPKPPEPDIPAIPGSYTDRILEARWHQDREEWEAADAIYQRLVDRLSRLPERRRPPGSDLHAYLVASAAGLAMTRARLGDFGAADHLCTSLQAWDTENADAWSRYVFELHLDSGHVEEGLAGLQQLAEAQPGSLEAWMVLADEAIASGQSDLAERALAHAEVLAWDADNDLDRAGVHLARYDLLRMQHRWQEAGAEWDEALVLSPDIEEMQELVLRMFLEAELWDDARRYLDGAIEGPMSDYYEGYLAHRRGDKVRARALWRKVVEVDPQETDSGLGPQAMAWCYLGQPDQALTLLLDEVASGRSLNAPLSMTLALAWAMEGNLPAAQANLGIAAKILREHPGDKLSRLYWYDFDQLVQDETVKTVLRPFFEDNPK